MRLSTLMAYDVPVTEPNIVSSNAHWHSAFQQHGVCWTTFGIGDCQVLKSMQLSDRNLVLLSHHVPLNG